MNIRLPKPPIPENAQGYAESAVNATKRIDKLDLDYSPKSLEIVDGILDRFHRDRVPVDQIAAALFAFGCYVGEVFVRHCGGIWRKEDDTEMAGLAGFFIVVELPNNKICNPIGKVFKRVRDGEAESLPYFYHVFTTPQ
jgi:hypothetical protein